jgi:hypothetical protein
MNKKDIHPILLANVYLITCKLNRNCCENKKELARKYLCKTINTTLMTRQKKSKTFFNDLIITFFILLGINF